MNIKKQLNKIMNYVKELETLSDKQHDELLQYQLAAYNFVNNKVRPSDTAEEFKRLLGVTMFIGGDFSNAIMEKFVGNHWMPIEHEHPEYAKVVDENAKLREALRWHPVSELPPLDQHYDNDWSVNVLLKITDKGVAPRVVYYSYNSQTWYDYHNGDIIFVSQHYKWCYIPEENDGE